MSKPWFLQMALEAEPSPLAERISQILQKPLPKLPSKSENVE